MDDAFVIPIVAMTIPIVIVPVALVTRYWRQRRQWQHLERLKAIEHGISPFPSPCWPALVAIALGAGVPVGSFFIAWLAVEESHADESVFAMAMIVGIVGVVSGYKLAMRLIGPAAACERSSPVPARSHGKPYVGDPDAYDVAGRRG